MRHFNIAYTGAYNRRHTRGRSPLPGTIQSDFTVEGDIYLLELSRKLHLNPIRIQLHKGKGYVEDNGGYWKSTSWSSLRGYLKACERESWVNYDEVLGQVGGIQKPLSPVYRRRKGMELQTPWKKLKGQVILGLKEFF